MSDQTIAQNRCQTLAAYLTFVSKDSNVSPSVNVTAVTKLLTAVTAMGVSITAGTLTPAMARVTLLTYMATYASAAGFSCLTDFVTGVSIWSTSNGSSRMVWDGFVNGSH